MRRIKAAWLNRVKEIIHQLESWWFPSRALATWEGVLGKDSKAVVSF